MDCAHPAVRPNLRVRFLDFFIVLQQGQLLHIF